MVSQTKNISSFLERNDYWSLLLTLLLHCRVLLFYPDGKRSSSAEGAHIDAGGQLLPPHHAAGGANAHAAGVGDGVEGVAGYAAAMPAGAVVAAAQGGGGAVAAGGGGGAGGGGAAHHHQQQIAARQPAQRRDTTVRSDHRVMLYGAHAHNGNRI